MFEGEVNIRLFCEEHLSEGTHAPDVQRLRGDAVIDTMNRVVMCSKLVLSVGIESSVLRGCGH